MSTRRGSERRPIESMLRRSQTSASIDPYTFAVLLLLGRSGYGVHQKVVGVTSLEFTRRQVNISTVVSQALREIRQRGPVMKDATAS